MHWFIYIIMYVYNIGSCVYENIQVYGILSVHYKECIALTTGNH